MTKAMKRIKHLICVTVADVSPSLSQGAWQQPGRYDVEAGAESLCLETQVQGRQITGNSWAFDIQIHPQ